MSLITEVMSRSIASWPEKELAGITKIREYAFYGCTALRSVSLPDTITEIGMDAFHGCTALTDVQFGNIYPYSLIYSEAFADTPWLASLPKDEMICISQDRILLTNTISDPTAGFVIPDTVVNLASHACEQYGGVSLVSVIIPDSVEIVQSSPFYGHSSLTTITVGASVRKIRTNFCPGTQTTTLIFRQPAGMEVELPPAGDGTGLSYNKSSHAIAIYTDNECIKNYDWATDNVTATFYPLSEAPV